MAATVAPDMPREGRVHNPRHLSLSLGGMLKLEETVKPTDASTSSQSPPPNPPFVFPSRPMAASTPRANGRRPRSVIDIPSQALGLSGNTSPRQACSSELPAFSFNPGAGLSPSLSSAKAGDDLLSPPRSPRLSPSRAGQGHKRGGSEFVGGEYRSGSARMELLDYSPTRPETVLTSPQSEPTRRGPAHRHAHRRSAAMSSHDLNSVLGLNLPKNPGEVSRGSSAPSSPSGPELNKHFSFPLLRPADVQQQSAKTVASQPGGASPVKAQASPTTVSEPTSADRKSFGKARVGFSDTLEFIPRPLSLVSSDTSSTATVRPGHSVSGSISSMISISNSIIFEESMPLEATPSQAGSESRPSTAGAVLDRNQTQAEPGSDASRQRRGSMPLLTDISLSAPGPSSAEPSPSRYSKKWSLFNFDQKPGSSSPSKSRPSSLNSGDATKEGDSAPPSSDARKNGETGEFAGATAKVAKKSGKKQRKVKKWAGSILIRPNHHRKGKKAVRRGPTPPPPRHTSEDDEDNASDSADTKSEPSMPTVMITELDDQFHGGVESWKPPRPFTDDDTSFPMIDLDAALGPFNTPLPRNPEWEAAQKAGGLMRRQLHSAAGMSRFSGPGGHYVHHQRAQSSPEMPPFEFRRGMNRFGSSSTMADVFEEDEEGDSEGADDSGSSTPQPESVGIRDSEASSICDYSSARLSAERLTDIDEPRASQRKHCDLEKSMPQRAGSVKSVGSLSSIQEQVIEEESCSPSFRTVEFGGPIQQRLLSAPDSPMSSPVSPRAPLESSSSQTTASSLAPISPYSTTPSSMPSPRSPFYDSNIISTAPSSATDDSFQSLLMGEPGPEVRKSLDVPSLASSHSTQPRENLFAQQAAQLNRPLAPGERPASFSMIGFGGRRGSLASLSRLISSSHGERSKLSLEVSFNDSDQKAKEIKPKRRLSRMVQFWKTKENKRA